MTLGVSTVVHVRYIHCYCVRQQPGLMFSPSWIFHTPMSVSFLTLPPPSIWFSCGCCLTIAQWQLHSCTAASYQSLVRPGSGSQDLLPKEVSQFMGGVRHILVLIILIDPFNTMAIGQQSVDMGMAGYKSVGQSHIIYFPINWNAI